MVAHAIAYALVALLVIPGVYGLFQVATDREPPGKSGSYIFGSFFLLFAAWGCAHFGGI